MFSQEDLDSLEKAKDSIRDKTFIEIENYIRAIKVNSQSKRTNREKISDENYNKKLLKAGIKESSQDTTDFIKLKLKERKDTLHSKSSDLSNKIKIIEKEFYDGEETLKKEQRLLNEQLSQKSLKYKLDELKKESNLKVADLIKDKKEEFNQKDLLTKDNLQKISKEEKSLLNRQKSSGRMAVLNKRKSFVKQKEKLSNNLIDIDHRIREYEDSILSLKNPIFADKKDIGGLKKSSEILKRKIEDLKQQKYVSKENLKKLSAEESEFNKLKTLKEFSKESEEKYLKKKPKDSKTSIGTRLKRIRNQKEKLLIEDQENEKIRIRGIENVDKEILEKKDTFIKDEFDKYKQNIITQSNQIRDNLNKNFQKSDFLKKKNDLIDAHQNAITEPIDREIEDARQRQSQLINDSLGDIKKIEEVTKKLEKKNRELTHENDQFTNKIKGIDKNLKAERRILAEARPLEKRKAQLDKKYTRTTAQNIIGITQGGGNLLSKTGKISEKITTNLTGNVLLGKLVGSPLKLLGFTLKSFGSTINFFRNQMIKKEEKKELKDINKNLQKIYNRLDRQRGNPEGTTKVFKPKGILSKAKDNAGLLGAIALGGGLAYGATDIVDFAKENAGTIAGGVGLAGAGIGGAVLAKKYLQKRNLAKQIGPPTNPKITPKVSSGGFLKNSLKFGGKLLKGGGKLIPFVGAGYGAYDTHSRYKEGDYLGAGLAGIGTVASLIPGIGTVGNLAIQGGLQGIDYLRSSPSKNEELKKIVSEKENISKNKTSENINSSNNISSQNIDNSKKTSSNQVTNNNIVISNIDRGNMLYNATTCFA